VKSNRKNRALSYIRQKNHYRLGGKSFSYYEVSETAIPKNIESIVKDDMKKLQVKYKMPFKAIAYFIGWMDDDFANDLLTLKVEIQKDI